MSDPFDGLDAVEPGEDPFAGLDEVEKPASKTVDLPTIHIEGDVPQPMSGWEALARGAADIAGFSQAPRAYEAGARAADLVDRAKTFVSDKLSGEQSAYRESDSGQQALEQYDRDDAQALDEQEGLYRLGQGAGAVATAGLPMGRVVQAGSRAAKAANLAAAGGLMGGFAASGATRAEDPLTALAETATGAALGAAVAPLAGEAAGWVGRKAQGAVGGLKEIADTYRLRAAGADKGTLKRLADRAGGHARYAEGAERLGIGMGGVGPQRVQQYADDAERVVSETGVRKEAIESALEAAGATVPSDLVASKVAALQSDYGTGPAGLPMRSELQTLADEFRGMGSDVPFSAMNLERRTWGDATNFDSSTPRQKLRKDVYGAVNDAMGESADAASPGSGQAWRSANEDQHIALTLQEMADSRINGERANRVSSPTDYLAAGMGTAAGAYGDQNPVLGGAAAVLLNRGIRGREHAAIAGMSRAAQKGLQSIAGPGQRAVEKMATRGVAQSGFEPLATVSAEDREQALEQFRAGSTGQNATASVEQALQSDPSVLGSYAPMFQEAAQSGDDKAVAALLHRLQADQRFRTEVLPQLGRR